MYRNMTVNQLDGWWRVHCKLFQWADMSTCFFPPTIVLVWLVESWKHKPAAWISWAQWKPNEKGLLRILNAGPSCSKWWHIPAGRGSKLMQTYAYSFATRSDPSDGHVVSSWLIHSQQRFRSMEDGRLLGYQCDDCLSTDQMPKRMPRP